MSTLDVIVATIGRAHGLRGEVAGVQPRRPEPGAGDLPRGAHRGLHVVGVHQHGGAGALGGELGAEGVLLAVEQQREGVRGGARGGDAVVRARGEVRGGGEADQVRGAGRGDRGAPISIRGRPRAAVTMREPTEATPLSWLRIESTTVSSSTAFSKVPSIRSTGEFGKNSSPSW